VAIPLFRGPRTRASASTAFFSHIGHELIAAGMIILAAGCRGLPFDYDELERWTRVGYERGIRFRKGGR